MNSLRSDVWYKLSGYHSLKGEMLCTAVRTLGVPVVIHWMGTDVLKAGKYFAARPGALRVARRFHHWATAPWLADELRTLGIEAELMPFPVHKRLALLSMPLPPLPREFSLIAYIPDSEPSFYGWELIERLAKERPEVTINIVSATGTFADNPPANVSFLGWVEDMAAEYARSTAAVRMTVHDGYSGSIQEPLMLCRHGIWTHPFPHCRYASDYQMLRAHVDELLHMHQRGALELNTDARDYIRANLHPEILAENLRTRLLEIVCGT